MKTLQELSSKIESENEMFDKASIPEKRMIIAQDCIDRLRLGSFKAYTGQTCRFINSVKGNSIKEMLETQIYEDCKACAKGGLFLSYVGRVNKFDYCDLENNSNHNSAEMVKLLQLFDEDQLYAIEVAFEGRCIFEIDSYLEFFDVKDLEILEYFFSFYIKSDDRLIAICKNIISNNGEFVWRD